MDTATLSPQVGELIEKGQQAVAGGVKTAVSDVANTFSDQVGLKNEANSSQTQTQNQNQTQNLPRAQEQTNNVSQQDLDATKDMVRDYYAPATQITPSQAELEEQQRQTQLQRVRQEIALELHNENYYNEIRDAGTSRNQTSAQSQQEEQVEEQKKMEDLQSSQKKDEDIAKFKAERQVEIKGGIVG